MTGSKSDYLEKQYLDHTLGGGTFTKPATVYFALSTALWSDANTGSSMSEISPSGTGYGRVAVTNNATNFPNATGNSPSTKQNGTAITFPTATASQGTARSYAIVDAASGGNVLYGGDLLTAKDIGAGDTATFAANTITVTED